VRSDDLATSPAVVIASEPMDDDPGWRLLASGELLHVDGDLTVSSRRVLEAPPAHLLTLADLDPRARSSQQPVS
jgi:glutamine amidotransferase